MLYKENIVKGASGLSKRKHFWEKDNLNTIGIFWLCRTAKFDIVCELITRRELKLIQGKIFFGQYIEYTDTFYSFVNAKTEVLASF